MLWVYAYGVRLYTLDSGVYGRLILTSKFGPRTERVKSQNNGLLNWMSCIIFYEIYSDKYVSYEHHLQGKGGLLWYERH